MDFKTKGYNVELGLEELPHRDKHENRYSETPENTKVHATTEGALKEILDLGLLPRKKSECQIWPDDRVPQFLIDKKPELYDEILQCREKNVYMWDDYAEGVGQGIATVSMLKEGNPVLLILDTTGLNLT